MNADTVPLSRVIGSLFYLLFFPAILFFLAGDWRWTEGWVYSVIFLLMSFGTLVYLYFHDPALLKERFGSPIQQTQKPWDKVLLSLFFVEFIVWFAICRSTHDALAGVRHFLYGSERSERCCKLSPLILCLRPCERTLSPRP